MVKKYQELPIKEHTFHALRSVIEKFSTGVRFIYGVLLLLLLFWSAAFTEWIGL
jgi:hypothetical protein